MASWTDTLSGLFQGAPQSAPSYTTSTSEVPQWLQDYTVDLFSQARGVAGLPYRPYELPRVASNSADTNQSQNLVRQNVGAWQPAFNTATQGMQNLANPNAGTQAGLDYVNQAGSINPMQQAQPLFNAAATGTATGMSGSALNTAVPYLNLAAQTATNNITDYMNPYISNVTDQIARLGARNLTENLLPKVSDQFIRAGQFGSSRMGEFGNRALRDTQEAILNNQSQALQQGYGQALNASQADLSRQAGLAQTVGGLSQSDLSRILQGSQQLGALGQDIGNLGLNQQQNLSNIGSNYANISNADLLRQQGALSSLGQLAQQGQGLRTSDAAALQAVGQQQEQRQQQGLDIAYQDFLTQQQWPQQQLGFMSNILRGLPSNAVPQVTQTQGSTTQYGLSPLQQLSSAYFTGQGLTKSGLL